MLTMFKKLDNSVVAAAIFALAEAFALRPAIAAAFALWGSSFLPNDIVLNMVAISLAVILGYMGGKLLFQKWQARLWVKAATASGIFLSTFILSSWISITIYRYLFISTHPFN